MPFPVVWGCNTDAAALVKERSAGRFLGSVGITIYPFSMKLFCELLCLDATAAACSKIELSLRGPANVGVLALSNNAVLTTLPTAATVVALGLFRVLVL